MGAERVGLDAAQAAIDRAHTEIGEIAKEHPSRRWRMSIPAQPDRDSDLLIANGLNAGRLAVAELRAARSFHDDIAAALAPGRMRGFDGPDGVSKDEVITDVAAALERYDAAGAP